VRRLETILQSLQQADSLIVEQQLLAANALM
jgi:hypothetical protein